MQIAWIKIHSSRKYGGAIYGEKVKNLLKRNFKFQEISIQANKGTLRYLKLLDWFFKISRIKGGSDIWIEDSFLAMAFTDFKKIKGKKVILIHHIDNSVFPIFFKPIFFLLEGIFYLKLRKADVIVAVSDYWQNYFLKKGCKDVRKIYNGFDLNDFNFSDQEINLFKEKYQLNDKPIIYIGNCQKAKGVVEAFDALKDLNVHLITSGSPGVKIPAKNLNLDYRGYLLLLKSSFVVVTMSKFKEGWCATSHEAMLCKTPVIGSGLGGMGELLEGGSQIVCQDFTELKEKVEYLLNNEDARIKMGENGFNYAKNFTIERLEKKWLKLINNL